jgi:hypothetical protein
VSGFSAAAGQKNGQFNQKNFGLGLPLQRHLFIRIRLLPGGTPPAGEFLSSTMLPSFIAAGSRSHKDK